MDYYGDHIDNKFGGCDVPFDGKVSEVIPAEEQLVLFAKAFKPVINAIVDGLIPAIKEIANAASKLGKRIMQEYPNKRVLHLALYSKKKRTRKKNIHRISKYFCEVSKNGKM